MVDASGAVLLGSQEPTHKVVPRYDYSDGPAAIELAETVGLKLDQYQQDFLTDALGRKLVADPVALAAATTDAEVRAAKRNVVERWAATEAAIELSRQNGKSVGFEVRVLAGLFVFRERLIVYTAHKGETAMEAFGRVADLIDSDPELRAEVKQVRTGNGKEYIKLHTGQMVKFRTRTAGGGRGLAGDCVILDEAQDLLDKHVAALFPIMAARSMTGDPQMWYGGSAGDRASVILGRLVRRLEAELKANALGNSVDPSFVMYRWAADLDHDDVADPRVWARTNPAVGRRISLEHIAKEFRAMGAETNPRVFAMERLGVGDYPREEGEEWVIPRRRWEAAGDRNSKALDPVVFALEVAWDRQATSIGVAGHRTDGHRHLEVVAHEDGTTWAVAETKRLVDKHRPALVVLDPGSPTNSLIPALRDAGIVAYDPQRPGWDEEAKVWRVLYLLKSTDLTRAYGNLYDGVGNDDTPATYHHTEGTLLTSSLAEAQTRKVGGSLTWARAGVQLAGPLLAVTWAAHGLDLLEPEEEEAPPPRRAQRRAGRGSELRTMGF